jgi:heptaprenyl diphosphate synthase
MTQRLNIRRVSFLGVLVALALALHLLEAQIPSPLPWVRPGLANLMTLIALLTCGWRAGLLVMLLRVVIGALLLGGFLSPAFALSLAGGLASTLVMALMARGAWRLWSPLAMSAAGAFAHGGAQVLVLWALLLRAGDLPWLLPWVLGPSLVSGIATGVLANLVLLRWQWYFRGVA